MLSFSSKVVITRKQNQIGSRKALWKERVVAVKGAEEDLRVENRGVKIQTNVSSIDEEGQTNCSFAL